MGKTILELGAGGALPGIVATLLGAKKVRSITWPLYGLLLNNTAHIGCADGLSRSRVSPEYGLKCG